MNERLVSVTKWMARVALIVGTTDVILAVDAAFAVAATFSSPTRVQLNWSTKSGQIYEVQELANWNTPWDTLTPTDLPAIAITDSLSIDLAAVDPRKFYQVVEHPSPYDPAWQNVAPLRTITFNHNAQQTDEQNGVALKSAILALIPGDQLEIGPGTYSIDSFTQIDLQGTAVAPIWIVATPDASVVITRPNASQNIINVGAGSPSHYVCIRGLEFVGGSHGIRLFDCANVWIDRCKIRDTGDVGLSANAWDTSNLHITRNEIWNTGGTGEGMYLGGNNGSVIMSESIIALNYVHDTDNGVSQGDGIEVKQGSWGNLIAANVVHDANYPCILVYGTAGQPVNIVENNICYRSNDNAMQIQGECIVRNNLVMSDSGTAFASQSHQGDPTKMTVVHNTFISAGNAVKLGAWQNGSDMLFANNACYSQNGAALTTSGGTAGVMFAGNVSHGSVPVGTSGFQPGTGLGDFVDVSWDTTKRNAKPGENSPLLEAASAIHATSVDLDFLTRTPPHAAGAHGSGTFQRIGWDGTLLWNFQFFGEDFTPSYDLEPMPNGNVLLCAGCQDRRFPGKLFEIEPQGKTGGRVVWECNVTDALGGNVSGYINSVSYNASLDQVLINTQQPGQTLAVFDHSNADAKLLFTWNKGFAERLHGSSWANDNFVGTNIKIPDADKKKMRAGNLLVVSNNDNAVVEIDPRTNQEVKRIPYEFSGHQGSAQRLPNGNTLIVSGYSNRVDEVDDDGNVVWTLETPGKSCARPSIRFGLSGRLQVARSLMPSLNSELMRHRPTGLI